MVIIAYRLAQGWAGPGGVTVMTGCVPQTVYFKLLWLSHPAFYLVNTQSWSHYMHPDKVCTNTSIPLQPTTSPQFPSSSVFFLFKLFLYHASISHKDQYTWYSLDLPKYASLQAFAYNSNLFSPGWHSGLLVWRFYKLKYWISNGFLQTSEIIEKYKNC